MLFRVKDFMSVATAYSATAPISARNSVRVLAPLWYLGPERARAQIWGYVGPSIGEMGWQEILPKSMFLLSLPDFLTTQRARKNVLGGGYHWHAWAGFLIMRLPDLLLAQW
jgi:hypothetical protein